MDQPPLQRHRRHVLGVKSTGGRRLIGTANTIDSTHGAMGGASELYPNALFPNSPTLVFSITPSGMLPTDCFPSTRPRKQGRETVLLAQPKVGSPYEPVYFWVRPAISSSVRATMVSN